MADPSGEAKPPVSQTIELVVRTTDKHDEAEIDGSGGKEATCLDKAKAFVDLVNSSLPILIFVVLVFFAVWHHNAIGNKLAYLTEVSWGTSKLTFEAKLEKLHRGTPDTSQDSAMRLVLQRADRYASALKGTRVLWVSDKPWNDRYLRDLLDDYGVVNIVVGDSPEALIQLQRQTFDVIVSNIFRPHDIVPCSAGTGDCQEDAGIRLAGYLAKHPLACSTSQFGCDARDDAIHEPVTAASFVLLTAEEKNPPPLGAALQTNRPYELIGEIVKVAAARAASN